MPFKTKHGLVGRHPATIVYNLHKSTAGILNHDRDLVRTGINCILHKFLHHGGRPLHDFPRGNHIRYIAR